MALLLSATDLAIRLAHQQGTLKMGTRVGRFGAYTFLEDASGVLEVFPDDAAAGARILALVPGVLDLTVSNVRWVFNIDEAGARRMVEGAPEFLVKYGR